MAEIANICDIAISGIPKNWQTFMENHHDLYNRAISILRELERTATARGQSLKSLICPPAERIFAFTDSPLEDIKIILIGQDPYPGVDKNTGQKEAEGHAFSVPDGMQIPASLRNIYKCLVAQKLMNEEDAKITGNLTSWSRQGVLLVNTALTTLAGAPGSHISEWKTFTRDLLISIGREYGNIIYILLGKTAQELIPSIPKNCNYLKWSHPSPLCAANRDESNPQHFSKCTVFTTANNMLRVNGRTPINWNPRAPVAAPVAPVAAPMPLQPQIMAQVQNELINPGHALFPPFANKIVVFVDGAASRNGCSDCCAAYATVIVCAGKLYKLCGMVEPINDDEGKVITPTNNRAELMALHEAFAFLLTDEIAQQVATSDGTQWSVLVVYDSAYAAGCVREWYANWCKKPPKEVKANIDIIKRAYEYKERVASLRKIDWYHIKSHKRAPEDELLQYYWRGNQYVDEIAQALTQK